MKEEKLHVSTCACAERVRARMSGGRVLYPGDVIPEEGGAGDGADVEGGGTGTHRDQYPPVILRMPVAYPAVPEFDPATHNTLKTKEDAKRADGEWVCPPPPPSPAHRLMKRTPVARIQRPRPPTPPSHAHLDIRPV